MEVPESMMRKKGKEDEQTVAELSSAHRRSQAKCQLVQTSYIKQRFPSKWEHWLLFKRTPFKMAQTSLINF